MAASRDPSRCAETSPVLAGRVHDHPAEGRAARAGGDDRGVVRVCMVLWKAVSGRMETATPRLRHRAAHGGVRDVRGSRVRNRLWWPSAPRLAMPQPPLRPARSAEGAGGDAPILLRGWFRSGRSKHDDSSGGQIVSCRSRRRAGENCEATTGRVKSCRCR